MPEELLLSMTYNGLKTLTLVQIGDIHYPEAKEARSVDYKDRSVPETLVDAITPKLLQNVIRSIANIVHGGVAGVLFCGDLTTKGNLDEYKKCVEYLKQSLGIGDKKKWKENQIHVVPGNHDIHRDQCDSTGHNLFGKFIPLSTAWKDINFPVFCNGAFRKTNIESEACKVNIFSANSCIGCGVNRFFPEPVQKALADVIREYEKSGKKDEAEMLKYETLDTPAFEKNVFPKICEEINDLDNTIMPIVVTHHNILPPATPRVALYTEPLNGGLVRKQLTSCHKSVLYCHGHVHNDPIEIVIDQKRNASQLICLSAPKLIDGFNVIIIEYSKPGIPLGCRILPYRRNGDSQYRCEHEQRIHLHNRKRHEHFCDSETSQIVGQLSGDAQRFPKILTVAKHCLHRRIIDRTLANMLLEAEWLGLIKIDDKNDGRDTMKFYPPREWKIARL